MNKYKTASFRILLVAGLINLWALPAAAIPIISVDLDTTTMGIQSTRTVAVGSTFTAQVVLFDTVPGTLFDSLFLETFYNDAGAVLGAGPTGATWLPSGLTGPFSIDLGTGVAPFFAPGGAPLSPPSPAPFPYAASSGTLALLEFFPAMVPLTLTPLFTLDFTALTVGTSTILAAGSPFGAPALAFAGAPILSGLMPATLTVAPPAVPEPSLIALILLGLAGIGYSHKRRAA